MQVRKPPPLKHIEDIPVTEPQKTGTRKFDVLALSAICVDLQLKTTDEHIDAHGLKKGLTNLVDSAVLQSLIKDRDCAVSPGSPGVNVVSGVALRGGKAALIGKTANDDHGAFLHRRLQGHGVDYTPLLSARPETATTGVLVLTTPDKERSFAFAAGAGMELAPEDIDESLIAQAKIVYLDSYLWLTENGKDAVHHAAALAQQSGSMVAVALNDAQLVSRNRAAFLALVSTHADILVGDKKEFMALFGTKTLEDTIAAIQQSGCKAALTLGAKGAYVVEGQTAVHVPALKINSDKIIDTNGAGDQFAAGFLYGIAQELPLADCAQQGARWASDIIRHMGAEPRTGKNAPQKSPAPPARDCNP
jgi:sugar/nucleoside kinase (ribokinase family)